MARVDMTSRTTLILLALLVRLCSWATATEMLSLDFGWKFHLGDVPFPVISGHNASYRNAKAGTAWGAAAPDFDDSNWPIVRLPHDWAVRQPLNPQANLSQGYRDRGIGWYRRAFRLSDKDRGKALELRFDGVATHCQVWLNGTLVHRNWCGYTEFSVDLTPFALYGEQVNQLAIRVDANAMEGWWYEGAGIYRHAWLIKRSPQHIITDGVHANPQPSQNDRWLLPVEVTTANISNQPARLELEATLLDPAGKPVATAHAAGTANPLAKTELRTQMEIRQPQLWSVDTPKLYSVRCKLRSDGKETDLVTTQCGFRTIRFDPKLGFFLNGAPLKIKGTCNHQDHAGVGVAVPDSLWEYRVRRLKELGSNAYRCAHNPPAREFLDACDRLGMLVMNENRNFNVSPEYLGQLEWLVRRDRNRPSVILWSVFNEESTQGTEMGYEMVRRMVAAVKRLDPSRPVTAAMSGGHRAPINVSQAVDVVGFNYNQHVYDDFHRSNPNLPMLSSEDTSTFSVRGCQVTDPSANIIDEFDRHHAPWGNTHRKAWRLIAERPFVAGGFVWTGFDYRGEPTPHQWPSTSSFFGIMDLCGFPKTAYYIHQAHWLSDQPVVRISPHWNAPADPAKPVHVMVITNGDRVRLFLNDQVVAESSVDPIDMAEFQIPYQPGTLRAEVFRNGKPWGSHQVETTGAAVALRITPDRPALWSSGNDAMPVTIDAVDAQGRHVPTAQPKVTFTVKGPGQILGVGNGDPNCHEPEHLAERSLFHGLAQVILAASSQAGTIELQANADGLQSAVATINVQQTSVPPSVPEVHGPWSVGGWRMSPLSSEMPEHRAVESDQDMNSWAAIQPGEPLDFGKGKWALFRTTLNLPEQLAQHGGSIEFRQFRGRAECFINGISAGRFEHPKGAAWRIDLPPGPATRHLTLRVQAKGKAGMLDLVMLHEHPSAGDNESSQSR